MEEVKSPTKDYKYKVELVKNIFDIRQQYSDAKRKNVEVMHNKRRGYFKQNLGIRAKDYKATKNSAAHFGEFIAYKLAEKLGLPACEVMLCKKNTVLKYSKTGKSVDVPGCISYVDLEEGQDFIPAANILSWYKMVHTEEFRNIVNEAGNYNKDDYALDPNNEKNNNNIELIIPAFETYAREKCNMNEDEIAVLRQNIINMVVFDCRFANKDRNDENYGLSTTENNKVRFYPMFDNEYILGFAEFEEDIKKYSGPRLQEHIDKDLYSTMGITSKPTKLGYQAMIAALFLNYPEETKKAVEIVQKVTESDLTELIEECEGLSETHKEYALRIFRTRQKGLEAIIDEYVDKHGNMKEQILPGKKAMEIIPPRSGSSGRKKVEKEISVIRE